jgi:hypothetical protein
VTPVDLLGVGYAFHAGLLSVALRSVLERPDAASLAVARAALVSYEEWRSKLDSEPTPEHSQVRAEYEDELARLRRDANGR